MALPAAISILALVDVTQHGAVGDGRTNDAPAIQHAIDTASSLAQELIANGTLRDSAQRVRVLLPRDRIFLSGPIFLKSNVDFHVASNTTLLGSPVFQDYSYAWQLWGYSRLSLINGAACVANTSSTCTQYAALSSVSLSGDDWTSKIDGNGQTWWYATNFWPSGSTLGRNPMLELEFITDLTVHTVQLYRSPGWTLHPWMCTGVVIDNVLVESGTSYGSWPYEGFNVDGFEPDNSADVLIQNSIVNAGDDCVAIDTSFTGNAYYSAIITHNVTVRNVTCRTPISIGARTTLGVYDVSVTNCTVDARGAALDPYAQWRPRWYACATRVKTHDGEGAAGVTNVTYSDLIVRGVDAVANYMLYYDCFNSSGMANVEYCISLESQRNASATPSFRNVRYERITGSAWRAAWLVCSPNNPCTDISFTNVSLSPSEPDGQGPFPYACSSVASVLDGGGNVPPVAGCAATTRVLS